MYRRTFGGCRLPPQLVLTIHLCLQHQETEDDVKGFGVVSCEAPKESPWALLGSSSPLAVRAPELSDP